MGGRIRLHWLVRCCPSFTIAPCVLRFSPFRCACRSRAGDGRGRRLHRVGRGRARCDEVGLLRKGTVGCARVLWSFTGSAASVGAWPRHPHGGRSRSGGAGMAFEFYVSIEGAKQGRFTGGAGADGPDGERGRGGTGKNIPA